MKRDPAEILGFWLYVLGLCLVAGFLLTGCGGGGDEPETPIQAQTEYRLEVLPATSSYQGNIEVCAPAWYAPRNMIVTATLDYAPNMTVYRNYWPVDKDVRSEGQHPLLSVPISVANGDSILVCATMPAPLTIYSGTVTIKEVQIEEAKPTIPPTNCQNSSCT